MNDTGSQIKSVVKVLFVINIIVSIILGIILIDALMWEIDEGWAIILGLLIIAFSIFLGWVSRLILCGFGELIENTSYLRKGSAPSESFEMQPEEQSETAAAFVCPACGAPVTFKQKACTNCGQSLYWSETNE